jgi:type VI secretion system protein VasD
VLLVSSLAACKSAPRKESLEVRITATADVNPDIESRPSPIVLHVLQLTDIVAFNGATYFELTRDDATALGSDALAKTEIVLAPGDNREIALELSPMTQYLGFVAGYRDINNARWQLSQKIVPGKTDWIAVNLGKEAITVTEVND